MFESLDPDINYFNSFSSSENSKYYSLDQFNNLRSNTGSNMTIFSMNIRSFFANQDSLLGLLASMNQKPDILVLSETWLTDENSSLCHIDGYTGRHTLRVSG